MVIKKKKALRVRTDVKAGGLVRNSWGRTANLSKKVWKAGQDFWGWFW